MIAIANFNNSRELSDIKNLYDLGDGTNIDILLEGFAKGEVNWSVPPKAVPGDVVVFMCAKEARHNLGMATSHIPANYGVGFQAFVAQQKALYKQYSGYLLGCGVIASVPEKDMGWWMADINQLRMFSVPVHIDDFRSFIPISTRGSITYLKPKQWERLKWLVNQKNPGFFQNVTPPDAEDLEKEFAAAVQKESSKSLNDLKKAAEKKSARAAASAVRTTVYHRDPTIAAYVKKRAAGCCQLCGMKAPFDDSYGEPYLECHHIDWLSQGGMDSVNNCVALCPNCHRKMHVINDPEDVRALKEIIV